MPIRPYELKISKNEKDIFGKKSMGLFSLQNLQRGKESGEGSCWQEIHGSVFITELAKGKGKWRSFPLCRLQVSEDQQKYLINTW